MKHSHEQNWYGLNNSEGLQFNVASRDFKKGTNAKRHIDVDREAERLETAVEMEMKRNSP